jgi:hypothetical protein
MSTYYIGGIARYAAEIRLIIVKISKVYGGAMSTYLLSRYCREQYILVVNVISKFG